jgi:hypothetical protein
MWRHDSHNASVKSIAMFQREILIDGQADSLEAWEYDLKVSLQSTEQVRSYRRVKEDYRI